MGIGEDPVHKPISAEFERTKVEVALVQRGGFVPDEPTNHLISREQLKEAPKSYGTVVIARTTDICRGCLRPAARV